MAKKQTAENAALVLFQGTDQLIEQSKNDLIINTVGSDEKIQQLIDTYSELTIAGIQDMASYKVVDEGIKILKKTRIDVEKYRKELTAPALKWQKDLKSCADDIISRLEPVEKSLLEKKSVIDDAKKAAEQQLFTERTKTLAENGYQLAGQFYICGALQVNIEMITQLSDDEFTFYTNEGQKELKRIEAEKQRKQAEQDELNRKIQELEAREKRLAELEAKLNAKENEINAQTIAIEKTYEEIEKPIQKNETTASNEVIPQPEVEIQKFVVTEHAVHEFPSVVDAFGDEIETNQFTHGFRSGFEAMKSIVVSYIETEEKITRKGIVEFVKSQNHDDAVL